jgi:hypothetical protein
MQPSCTLAAEILAFVVRLIDSRREVQMATNKAPAKKTAKRAPAKKTPAKKAAKRTPAKKAVKRAPAKKASKKALKRTPATKTTKRAPAKKAVKGLARADGDRNASQLIDARIKDLDDWRGEMLSRIRTLIKKADPGVLEEWKWRGTPVWSHDGMICTGETYKSVVKVTFAKGASLSDPAGLFNSSLEGNVRRAIDFREGETINERALSSLIRAAITLNASTRRR